MKQGTLVVIGLCGMLLGGCASVPMTSASLDSEAKTFTPPPGKANIYVNRGGGLGTAVTVQVILDGRVVGALAPNTYMLLSVPPGEHVLSTGAGAEKVEIQKLNAEAGKNYFYRVSLAMGWVMARVHLRPMTEEEGRKAVLGSKRAEAVTF
ncbi:MAG: DUF2846 domain-containing protein [Verrucomicrobiales bacterium]|nr:DUF2846 domain-containing protein [Verrucomicrobiales bacterium]